MLANVFPAWSGPPGFRDLVMGNGMYNACRLTSLFMPMPRLVCRMFAALSVSFAPGHSAYAAETLRGLACIDGPAIMCSVKDQRLSGSRIGSILEPVTSNKPNRHPIPVNTIEVSHRAGNSDKINCHKTSGVSHTEHDT